MTRASGFKVRCAALVLASLLMTAGASAADWQIVQQTGEIWVGSDAAQHVSLGSMTSVPEGSTLVTGNNGRAMLVRGTQAMLVSPNTVVTVPTTDDEQGFATVLQRTGEVEFDVDRQKTPHFAVETPYLAAVVKGTHFVVNIENAGAAVSVVRGLVEVTDLATGERVDTPAGQQVKVSGKAGKFTISGTGTLATIVPGNARAPLVSAVSEVELAALQTSVPGASGGSSSGDNKGIGDIAALGAGAGGSGSGGNDSGGSNDGNTTGGNVAASTRSGSGPTGETPTGGGDTSATMAAGPDNNKNADSLPVDLASGGTAVSMNIPEVGDGPARIRIGRDADTSITPLAIAVGIALSAMLAFGLAYLRGRAN